MMTLAQLNTYRYSIRHILEETVNANEVECFVNAIPDEYMRKMISARYIKGLTWREIADAFAPNSEDSCRMAVKRYLHSLGVD